MPPKMHNNTQAILWMISVALFVAISTAIVRVLSSEFHPLQIVFMANIVAVLFTLPWLYKSGFSALKTSKIKLLGVRSIFEFGGLTLSVIANPLISLPILTSINFLTPLLTVSAAIFLLKEKSNIHTWVALLMGFIGVLIIVRPGFIEVSLGVILMIGATICFSTCSILIKKLTFTEQPHLITFYMFILTGLIAMPFAIYFWKTPTLEQFMIFLALGVTFYLLQYSVSHALSKAKLVVILPFSFTGLIFMSTISYYAFDELVDIWTISGGAIILLSSIYTARHSHREIRKENARTK